MGKSSINGPFSMANNQRIPFLGSGLSILKSRCHLSAIAPAHTFVLHRIGVDLGARIPIAKVIPSKIHSKIMDLLNHFLGKLRVSHIYIYLR